MIGFSALRLAISSNDRTYIQIKLIIEYTHHSGGAAWSLCLHEVATASLFLFVVILLCSPLGSVHELSRRCHSAAAGTSVPSRRPRLMRPELRVDVNLGQGLDRWCCRQEGVVPAASSRSPFIAGSNLQGQLGAGIQGDMGIVPGLPYG